MIRFTEGKEEGDLAKHLLAKVGANERRKVGSSPSRPRAFESELFIVEKKTKITLETVVDTQHSLVVEEDDKEEENDDQSYSISKVESIRPHRFSETAILDRAGVSSIQYRSSSSSLSSSTMLPDIPQHSGTGALVTSNSMRITAKPSPPTGTGIPRSTTTMLRKSAPSQGKDPPRIRRAPLCNVRTTRLEQFDEDFPDAGPGGAYVNKAVVSTATTYSAARLQSKPLRPRGVGLSASKAPSAKRASSTITNRTVNATKTIQSETRSSLPLSERMAALTAAAKKQKTEASLVIIEDDTVEGASIAQSQTEGSETKPDSVEQDVLSTPKRQSMAALPTGSSVKRSGRIDLPSQNGLSRMLAQARARVVQDYTNLSIKRNERPAMDNVEKLVLTVVEVDYRSVDEIVLTSIVQSSVEGVALKQHESINCIVPLHTDDVKDDLCVPLRNLKHIAIDSNLEGSTISVYRPWRVVSDGGESLARPVVVCSGLVSVVETNETTNRPS